jgi:von Willebrand factor type A domain
MRSFLFIPCIWLLLLAIPVQAESKNIGLKPDLRLLIDTSRTMDSADPDNLRTPALELMVRLIPDGSKAGIWEFAESVEMLVPHGVVDNQWREQAYTAIESLKNNGQGTNIPAALEQATADLESPAEGYRSSVVLVTSGRVEVADSPMVNVSAARKLLTGLAVELGGNSIPVHTIAFSREADAMLLRSLSRETGGTNRQARSAEELGSLFLRVLEMVAPVGQVPLIKRQFIVDERVEEIDVLTFFSGGKGKLKLVDPSGQVYSSAEQSAQVEWYRNRQFAFATVFQPMQGVWSVQMPKGATARVMVVSDLQLEVGALPNYVVAGHQAEIALRLTDAGEPITDPEMLARFRVSLEVTHPLGKQEVVEISEHNEAGIFRVASPPLDQPGRYRLMVRVDSDGLQRDLPVYIEVGVPPEKPTLVTRGEEPPEDDFHVPLMWLSGVSATLLVAVWFVLRRRKQRKLALWQKRSRELNGNGHKGTASLATPTKSDDGKRLD